MDINLSQLTQPSVVSVQEGLDSIGRHHVMRRLPYFSLGQETNLQASNHSPQTKDHGK
jgi:hypothetical protein